MWSSRGAAPHDVSADAAVIITLADRLNMRQRVAATATMYYLRFYSKNAYAATDPVLVLCTCMYVASKTEESPVRARTLCAEATKMFREMGQDTFELAPSALTEMEYYLIEDLDYDLIVHHPYRTLLRLHAAGPGASPEGAHDSGSSASLEGASGRETNGADKSPRDAWIDSRVLQAAWCVRRRGVR